jgi:hypothetical protein
MPAGAEHRLVGPTDKGLEKFAEDYRKTVVSDD